MMKFIRAALFLCLTLIILAASSASVWARGGGDAGSNAADFLRLGVGAAAAGQGEAFVARSGRIESLYYNPAGLAGLNKKIVQFQHNNYILDIKSEYLAVAFPGKKRWSFGASVFTLDEGDFTRRTISDPNGIGTFSAKSWVASVGVGGKLTEKVSVGGAVRSIHEEIDNASRDGLAFDFGFHARPWGKDKAEFGLSFKNLGSTLKFDREEERLAREVRFGISIPGFVERVRLSLQIDKVRNQQTDFRAGLSRRFVKLPFVVRGGFNTQNDLGSGFSVGAGYFFKNARLDYSFVPFSVAGDSHRFSIDFEF